MTYFVTALRENPELAIFLTLAVGFVIGRMRIRIVQPRQRGRHAAGRASSSASSTSKIDPIVKVVFFDLFLFATGYKVGPQFFRGLKKNAGPQVALTLVLCVTSLVVTVTAAKIFHYDSGTAAGLMAGAFTESTVIGTAGQTIEQLDIPEADKRGMLNNIPVAYAVSYLVGTGFVVWFLSSLAPRLLKVNLKAESRKLEQRMAASTRSEAGQLGVPRVGPARLSHQRARARGQSHGRGLRAIARARTRVRGTRFARAAPSWNPRPDMCWCRATRWSLAPGAT